MNKIFYKKNGQITPFMLAIMVILIIAVMVTMNIGKVSLTKTHSANAADAGSLASASAMANIFNMIAEANSTLRQTYWVFFATLTTIWFPWAAGQLGSALLKASMAEVEAGSALSKACVDPCSAKGDANAAAIGVDESKNTLGYSWDSFSGIINLIFTEINATYLAQWNFYNQMRDDVLDGHNSAVRLAFQLAFSNSGISQKLIPGSAPSDPAQLKGNVNNYQSSFSNFMDGIWVSGNPVTSRQPYPWIDGQNRTHQVDVDVSVEPPEKYEVRVTNLPYPAEWLLFIAIRLLVYSAWGDLYSAKLKYESAKESLEDACKYKKRCKRGRPRACIRWRTNCAKAKSSLDEGLAINSRAINEIGLISIPLVAAFDGVSTEWNRRVWKDRVRPHYFTEDILAWIEDVGSSREEPHNGRVRVGTVQAHQGVDLGLWQTQYPNITSFSVANFRYDRNDNPNQGRINPPESHHEASIVQTD